MLGVPSRSDLGEGHVGIATWTGDVELPGVSSTLAIFEQVFEIKGLFSLMLI